MESSMESSMENLISDLVRSVIQGFKYGTPDFTNDLPQTFTNGPEAVTREEARKEWHRYADYRRGIDLRKARNHYLIHRNPEILAEEFMEAYYESNTLKKTFERK